MATAWVMVPEQITAESLEVLSNDALSAAIVRAEVAYNLACRTRDLHRIADAEARLTELESEQRSRSPYWRYATALHFGLALDSQRHGLR